MAGFEKDLLELESVVERLERGDLSLDESVRLFEEGTKLAQTCKKDLDRAEGRIQVLLANKAGKMETTDLDLNRPTAPLAAEGHPDEE